MIRMITIPTWPSSGRPLGKSLYPHPLHHFDPPQWVVLLGLITREYKGIEEWRCLSIISSAMSMYHNTHWHVFYKDLSFSPHVPVAMNCYTFDALHRLSDADANLFFCTGHCFMCKNAVHHTKHCSLWGPPLVLCKCLNNPHRT
jgi:hypothetical protein